MADSKKAKTPDQSADDEVVKETNTSQDTKPELDDSEKESVEEKGTEQEHSEQPDEEAKTTEESTESHAAPGTPASIHSTTKIQRLKNLLKTKKGKIIAGVVGLVLILGLAMLIPTTRYASLGMFVKKDVSIKVVDQTTGKKVTEASVTLAGKTAKTDKEGVAKFTAVPVGQYTLTVEKKYYKKSSASYTVPVFAAPSANELKIAATGRQVTITVTNKITKKPVEKVTVEFGGSSATTDGNGQATLVLPANTKAYEGTAKADKFNTLGVSVKVEDKDDQKAAYEVTPEGKIFFLSKRTGKINVMKSNLDGTSPEVVVEGTGKEDEGGTVLLASRDWNHLALLSQREGSRPKIYSINTKTNDLKVIDEGAADFSLVGWANHRFLYTVNRVTNVDWADKKIALKSYDVDSGKLTTLDETAGEGTTVNDYKRELIYDVFLVGDEAIYAKSWSVGPFYDDPYWLTTAYGRPSGKKNAVMVVKTDGSSKKRVKEFDTGRNVSLAAQLYKPKEVYFRATDTNSKATYYEYEDGKLISANIDDDKFYTYYATYLQSPSGDKTLWTEARDGNNVQLVGNAAGEEGKTVASLRDYIPYGWYSDDYVLMSKNRSELYIAPVSGVQDEKELTKVTDYHRPGYTYSSYGGGYGGY